MVQGKWFPGNGNLEIPLSLREKIFGSREDLLDEWAQQVVVYEAADCPVGVARLRWSDGAFRIDFLGVLAQKRNQGFGDLLVRLCLFKALSHQANRVELSCSQELVPYFSKYGFHTGSLLPDGTIPMVIRAEQIHLDHCNGHCDGCQ